MKLLEKKRPGFVALGTFMLAPALFATSSSVVTPPVATVSSAQSSCFGTCTAVPAPCTPQEFHHQWGGTIRGGTFRRAGTPAVNHIWTAEDGGRVRHSTDDGASFAEQEAPREVEETLRSVHFLRDGLTGWGVSEDGYVIGTVNGGGCWKVLSHLSYGSGDAELWDIHFLSATIGFVAGEHVLKSTTDGGCTWTDEALSLPSGMTIATVEFYALDCVRGSGCVRAWAHHAANG